MEHDEIIKLLMALSSDISYIKARLETMETVQTEHKELHAKVEKLEMQNERHENQILKLEHRQEAIENHTRNSLESSNKTKTSIFISAGLAVFSALVSLIINLL